MLSGHRSDRELARKKPFEQSERSVVNECRGLHSKELRPEEDQWQLRHQIVDRAQAVLIAQMMTVSPPVFENLISCRKTFPLKFTVGGECGAATSFSTDIVIMLSN